MLGDLEEMDPMHGKLEALLDASQFALLAAMDRDVRDYAFLNKLKNSQINDAAQDHQDDTDDVQDESENKRVDSVLRSRKSTHRLEKIRRRQEILAGRP